MNVENSLKAIHSWALEIYKDINRHAEEKITKTKEWPVRVMNYAGRGLMADKKCVKLLNNINSEGRKVEYKRSGIKELGSKINRVQTALEMELHSKPNPNFSKILQPLLEQATKLKMDYNEKVKKRIAEVRATAQQIVALLQAIGKNYTMEYNKALRYAESMASISATLESNYTAINNEANLLFTKMSDTLSTINRTKKRLKLK